MITYDIGLPVAIAGVGATIIMLIAIIFNMDSGSGDDYFPEI